VFHTSSFTRPTVVSGSNAIDRRRPETSKNCKSDVIKLLLKRGAHIDARNLDGKCFDQLLQSANLFDIINPLDYLTLQCLAATAVVKYKIPYEFTIPQKLAEFVKLH